MRAERRPRLFGVDFLLLIGRERDNRLVRISQPANLVNELLAKLLQFFHFPPIHCYVCLKGGS